MNTKKVVSEDSQGEKVELFVKKPNAKQLTDARASSIEVVSKALDSGVKTREQMLDYMKEHNIFGEKEEKKIEELSDKIRDGARQLARGGLTPDGKKFTKEDGRKLAIKMRDWRAEQMNLTMKQRELDQYTLQGQADNHEFNYLVSQCTFDEEGNLVFKSVEDYLDHQEEPYAFEAAKSLAEMTNQVDSDYEKKLPENKFLIKYGFARESDLRLTNEDGHLVDREGRLINEDGRFVDKDGNLVDKQGNKVDEDGNPVEEFTEFE